MPPITTGAAAGPTPRHPRTDNTPPLSSQSQSQVRATRQRPEAARPSQVQLRNEAHDAYPTPEAAKDFLVREGYLPPETPATPEHLNQTLLLLAHWAPLKTLQAGTQAVARLLEIYYATSQANALEELITEKLSVPLTQLRRATEALQQSADRASANIERQYNTFEEIRDEMQNTADDLRAKVDQAVTQIQEAHQEAPIVQARNQHGNGNNTVDLTYATALTRTLPHTHGTTMARARIKDRQVLVDRTTRQGADSLAGLTEQELVAKANMAIQLMNEQDNEEDNINIRVVGAKRLQNGGIVYEMESAQAARTLRTNKDRFIAHYGEEAIVKERSVSLLAEYVPTSHDQNALAEYRKIERDSNLPPMTLDSTKWIKPIEKRQIGQRTAHLIVRMTDINAANIAIKEGLIIAGKRVQTRKMKREPRRCLNCQKLNTAHIAATCPERTACGTCGLDHRTTECHEQDPSKYYCQNCEKDGHASWDRLCPMFTNATKRIDTRNPENNYRNNRIRPRNHRDAYLIYQDTRQQTPPSAAKTVGGRTCYPEEGKPQS